jgi:hypothetical protein
VGLPAMPRRWRGEVDRNSHNPHPERGAMSCLDTTSSALRASCDRAQERLVRLTRGDRPTSEGPDPVFLRSKALRPGAAAAAATQCCVGE